MFLAPKVSPSPCPTSGSSPPHWPQNAATKRPTPGPQTNSGTPEINITAPNITRVTSTSQLALVPDVRTFSTITAATAAIHARFIIPIWS